MDRPTLAGILRTHGSTYRRSHALSPTQARAWRAIVDCRTAALGGVRERCANCGAERHVWRSCRNRHCPQCQTRAKEAWRAARLREVLPVPSAHWVFTLPHALNPLAIRHPRWLYGALFDSAAATLLARVRQLRSQVLVFARAHFQKCHYNSASCSGVAGFSIPKA